MAIRFGPAADAGKALTTLALPWLAGNAHERHPADPGIEWGCEEETVTGGEIEGATRRLYARLLERVGSRSLARIWNYVPGINALGGHPPLEIYRAFSRARAEAFEAAWGPGFSRHLPAASAVGGEPGRLVAVFATSATPAAAMENPEQVPAYQYPAEHGPRPPSFSRATRVRTETREWVFVSGTAAIKGHRTIAPHQLQPQVACTLDNLRLIGAAAGVGDDLGLSAGWSRQFKVYLRRADDLAAARLLLEPALVQPGDPVVWLQADICRAELMIEIEVTLTRLRR